MERKRKENKVKEREKKRKSKIKREGEEESMGVVEKKRDQGMDCVGSLAFYIFNSISFTCKPNTFLGHVQV